MNRIFRIIWSKTRLTWVVASENAKRRGKGGGAVDERATALGLARDAMSLRLRHWHLRGGCVGFTAGALASAPAQAIDYYWDSDDATAGAGGPAPSGTWSALDAHCLSMSTALCGTGAHHDDGRPAVLLGRNGCHRRLHRDGERHAEHRPADVPGRHGESDRRHDQFRRRRRPSSMAMPRRTRFRPSSPGPTVVRFNGGTVTLTGTNTFTGADGVGRIARPGGGDSRSAGRKCHQRESFATRRRQLHVRGGFVTLGAAEQINDTATVTMASGHYSGSSVFSLNGFDETIGGINLSSQGNGSSVTVPQRRGDGCHGDAGGSGTYTTASGDRLTGRNIVDGGAGRLNFVVALTGAGTRPSPEPTPSYTGTTTVNSGTLRLWNTSAWASNVILDGGTLNLHQTATGTPVAAGGTPRPARIRKTIGGTGGTLRKTGDGTVILSGTNTYQGATQIDQGTLRAGSATAFGNNSAVTLANVAGATMDLNSFNIAIGSLAGGGTPAATSRWARAT